MPNDVADWSQHVTVDAGTVTISGTPSVSISGTPTVAISGPVSISGTVPVTISSGSVTIANASIAVINASGTKITSARPPTVLGYPTATAGNTVTQTYTLPADTQALFVGFVEPLSGYAHVTVVWTPNPGGTPNLLDLHVFTQQYVVIPVIPTFNTQTQIIVSLTAGGAAVSLDVQALFEPNPLWLEYFAPPFAEPNQPPLYTTKSLVNGTPQWIVTAAANIEITLFEFILLFWASAGANIPWFLGHGSALPTVGTTPPDSSLLFGGTNGGPFVYPLAGASLPRGDGVWVMQLNGATGNFISTLAYSLS